VAKLTVRGIDAAKAQERDYKLTVERGLYLRVATTGVKSWLVRYVVNGKQTQARLPRPYGNHGDGYMTLAEAVAENARIQALAKEGVDFQALRREEELARARSFAREAEANLPFDAMFREWIENGVSRSDGNAELKRSFGKGVLPQIGTKPVRSITEKDLLALLRKKGRVEGRNRSAVVLYRDLLQLFRWAEKRRPWRGLLIDGNAMELIDAKSFVVPGYDITHERDRILSLPEIAELQTIFRDTTVNYETALDKRTASRPLKIETQLALWIVLSTTCRIGELLKAEWKHVDLVKGEWFVPQQNTKTNVDWVVFLSSFALKHFRALHAITGDTPWCFPARRTDDHLCEKTVSKQIGDRQERFKNRKPLKNRRHDNSLVLANGGNGEWTPHDLRRTGSTLMQSLKVPEHVRERCLNHSVGGKIGRIYGRWEFADEKRDAWQKLGHLLETTLAGE